jgi:superfamily II DNA/RNA helicase
MSQLSTAALNAAAINTAGRVSAPSSTPALEAGPTFAELGLGRDLVDALAERGIVTPFQIQERVIPAALRGGDVLAKSPTGSGKTLAFAGPIVERVERNDERPTALVLVPTRELAVQVTEELVSLAGPRGLSVASVYGGVPLRAQADRARKAHVLVATPGRLQDLVDRKLVALDAITILVLDEADRMLDMGFKPQVDRIVRLLRPERQTMFFSATLDGAVGELARAYTRSPARFEAELPYAHAAGEIDHRFVPVTAENKVETLVELLEAERGLALVFVRTKRGADRLAQRLARHDVHAVAMHGDKTQAAREKALARFEAGKVTTLIATDVAARGLDLDDVTHVINYDPPEDEKAYTHRVGRTGRAGRSGTGVTLVLPEQQGDVSRVARLNGQTESFEETGMKVAPPRLVYSSRRRNSKWGPSRPRRKI